MLAHEFTLVQVSVPSGPRATVFIGLASQRRKFMATIGGRVAGIGKLLVVGGGVAGLTAAAALHRHGFTTELVERAQTWHALGAGFLVHANGMRMLRSLGLQRA